MKEWLNGSTAVGLFDLQASTNRERLKRPSPLVARQRRVPVPAAVANVGSTIAVQHVRYNDTKSSESYRILESELEIICHVICSQRSLQNHPKEEREKKKGDNGSAQCNATKRMRSGWLRPTLALASYGRPRVEKLKRPCGGSADTNSVPRFPDFFRPAAVCLRASPRHRRSFFFSDSPAKRRTRRGRRKIASYN